MQLSRLPLKLRYPIAPRVGTSFYGLKLVYYLHSPDLWRSGKGTGRKNGHKASKGVLSSRISPCTFVTTCITWEYLSMCIRFFTATVPNFDTLPISFLPGPPASHARLFLSHRKEALFPKPHPLLLSCLSFAFLQSDRFPQFHFNPDSISGEEPIIL